MDENMIADLKQLVAATVRQELSGFAAKDDLQNLATKDDLQALATKDDLHSQIGSLRSEMNQRFNDVDAKLEAIADAYAETLQDHDQRLSRLESQAA